MNLTLFLSFLRQRFTTPARLALIFIVFTFPLATLVATRGGIGFQPLGTGTMFAFVLGAGMIGGDASSGVFQLLFARPVTRFQYLISRWLAVGLGAAALNAVQVVLAAMILSSNNALEGWPVVARFIGEQSLEAIAVAAVIACFSSVLPGIGDVVAIFASSLVLGASRLFLRSDRASLVIGEIERTLSPDVSFDAMFPGGSPAWSPIVTLATTIVLGLTIAAIMLDRREISYASD